MFTYFETQDRICSKLKLKRNSLNINTKINGILRRRRIGVTWYAAARAVIFRISLRRPIIINVYTLFFSDTRWTTRQTISSGENIVSSITYLHKFNICRMSKKTEYIGCKFILQICAAILYLEGLIWNAVNSILCK